MVNVSVLDYVIMGIRPSSQYCGVFDIRVSETSEEASQSDVITEQQGAQFLLQTEWLSDVCGIPKRR